MALPYIKLYKDFISIAEALDTGARGKLFLAILQYANGIEFGELTGAEKIAFLTVKGQIDRDGVRSDEITSVRSEAGKKGAESRWQNDSKNSKCHLPQGKNSNLINKDNDNDNDNDHKGLSSKELADEFEGIWALYPRKEGKKAAQRHYMAARKRGVDCELVKKGVIAYSEHVKAAGTEAQYIKMGSTYFSGECWNDVLIAATPKSQYRSMDDVTTGH